MRKLFIGFGSVIAASIPAVCTFSCSNSGEQKENLAKMSLRNFIKINRNNKVKDLPIIAYDLKDYVGDSKIKFLLFQYSDGSISSTKFSSNGWIDTGMDNMPVPEQYKWAAQTSIDRELSPSLSFFLENNNFNISRNINSIKDKLSTVNEKIYQMWNENTILPDFPNLEQEGREWLDTIYNPEISKIAIEKVNQKNKKIEDDNYSKITYEIVWDNVYHKMFGKYKIDMTHLKPGDMYGLSKKDYLIYYIGLTMKKYATYFNHLRPRNLVHDWKVDVIDWEGKETKTSGAFLHKNNKDIYYITVNQTNSNMFSEYDLKKAQYII